MFCVCWVCIADERYAPVGLDGWTEDSDTIIATIVTKVSKREVRAKSGPLGSGEKAVLRTRVSDPLRPRARPLRALTSHQTPPAGATCMEQGALPLLLLLMLAIPMLMVSPYYFLSLGTSLVLSLVSSCRHRAAVDVNMRRWPNAGLMLGHRRRRWTNITPTLGQRLVWPLFYLLFAPLTLRIVVGSRSYVVGEICSTRHRPINGNKVSQRLEELSCRANPKCRNCQLFKRAVTAFWFRGSVLVRPVWLMSPDGQPTRDAPATLGWQLATSAERRLNVTS